MASKGYKVWEDSGSGSVKKSVKTSNSGSSTIKKTGTSTSTTSLVKRPKTGGSSGSISGAKFGTGGAVRSQSGGTATPVGPNPSPSNLHLTPAGQAALKALYAEANWNDDDDDYLDIPRSQRGSPKPATFNSPQEALGAGLVVLGNVLRTGAALLSQNGTTGLGSQLALAIGSQASHVGSRMLQDQGANFGLPLPGLFFTYHDGQVEQAPLLSAQPPSVEFFKQTMPSISTQGDDTPHRDRGCQPGVITYNQRDSAGVPLCADFSRQGDAQRSFWAYESLIDLSQRLGYVPSYEQMFAATWIQEASLTWQLPAFTTIDGAPREWNHNERWENGRLLFGEALSNQMGAYVAEMMRAYGDTSISTVSATELMVTLREYAMWINMNPDVVQGAMDRTFGNGEEATQSRRYAELALDLGQEWVQTGLPANTPYFYGDPYWDEGQLIGEIINPAAEGFDRFQP